MKTLRNIAVGETAKVKRLHGEGALKRRIMDMGITKAARFMYARWLHLVIRSRSRSADMNCLCEKTMRTVLRWSKERKGRE